MATWFPYRNIINPPHALKIEVSAAADHGWRVRAAVDGRVIAEEQCSEWHRVERVCERLQRQFRHMAAAAAMIAILFWMPFAAAAQESPFDILIRVNGPVHVAANEATPSIIVIDDDVVVDGVVRGSIMVINGRADIRGTVERGLVIFNGEVVLGSAARVADDVLLYRSVLLSRVGGRMWPQYGEGARVQTG